MLEELEFIEGGRDDLSGQCVLYAHNASGSENPFNPKYPALAVAAGPADLLDIISAMLPMTDDMRENIMARLKESSEMWTRTMFGQGMYQAAKDMMEHGMDNIDMPEEMKEQMRDEMAFIPDENTGAPLNGCFVPLVGFDPGVLEPYKTTCDIIEAPEVPNVTYAGLVLGGHAQHYLAAYFMQSEKAFGGEKHEIGSEMPSYRDLPRQEFLTLLDGKVSELMYAYETGGDTDRMLKDLKKLTSGTYFVRDILNLAHLAETEHPRKIELMDLYLRRIHLLVIERYEDISAVDGKIRELQ